jgi:hypothetical protein
LESNLNSNNDLKLGQIDDYDITTPVQKEVHTVLSGIRWKTYQDLVLDLAETPSKRLTYNQGILVRSLLSQGAF